MTCWPWVGWEAHSPDLLSKSLSRYASAAPSEHPSQGGGEVKKELLTSQPQEIKESTDTAVYDASQVTPEI